MVDQLRQSQLENMLKDQTCVVERMSTSDADGGARTYCGRCAIQTMLSPSKRVVTEPTELFLDADGIINFVSGACYELRHLR